MSASEIPSDKYSAFGSLLVFSNGSTAMLFSNVVGVEAEFSVRGERKKRTAATPQSKIMAAARATPIGRTAFSCAEQRRSCQASFCSPGRSAGAIESIDLSSNLKRDGTRAEFR